jgi:hypothetical protein
MFCGERSVQKVFEQVQAQVKEAQVTPVSAMDDRDPSVLLGDDAQVDDPDVGQARCDHQACQVGRASWRLLYHAMEELLRAGQSLVVESNFTREYATPEFAALQGRYRFQTVQVVCQADEATLLRRFQQRAASGERHPGHVDAGNLDEFRDSLRRAPWGALDIAGRVIYVDTKDFGAIDYDQIANTILIR